MLPVYSLPGTPAIRAHLLQRSGRCGRAVPIQEDPSQREGQPHLVTERLRPGQLAYRTGRWWTPARRRSQPTRPSRRAWHGGSQNGAALPSGSYGVRVRRLRILFSAAGGHGHLQPLVPWALEASRSGHDVLVTAAPSLAGHLADLKIPFVASGPDLRPVRSSLRLYSLDQEREAIPRRFIGRLGPARARDLTRVGREWPHLIVSDESRLWRIRRGRDRRCATHHRSRVRCWPPRHSQTDPGAARSSPRNLPPSCRGRPADAATIAEAQSIPAIFSLPLRPVGGPGTGLAARPDSTVATGA